MLKEELLNLISEFEKETWKYPGSEQTIMWNAYNYEKTSQFNYFKVEG